MFADHYPALLVAYLVGLGGWLLANRIVPTLWPPGPHPPFAHPWKELGIALLGTVGVVAVGQLWVRGIRLPDDGPLGPVFGSFNQVIIFAPLLLVLVLRRQSWTTAWLPRPRFAPRLLTGLVLASLAVTAYALTRAGADPPWTLIGRIWRYGNLEAMTQVLLEDIAIAILFVRMAAATGPGWATVLVGVLFAAGHIPALLSGGAMLSDLSGLVLDAGLGVAVILVLQRSRDIVWFWCVHFCLDMTQFTRISGTS